jgi:hypothetical protein
VVRTAIGERYPQGNQQAAVRAGPSALPSTERRDLLTLLTSEIVIDAPSEIVWQVLVDFDSYPDWNPVEIQAKGEAVVGAAFEHTGKLPGREPRTFHAKIIEAAPPRALAWKGRILVPGLFDVRHHFEIDPLGDDRSRLQQFEHFSGVLVPLMRGVLRDTQAAFELANKAIKHRAESLAANSQNQPPTDVR